MPRIRPPPSLLPPAKENENGLEMPRGGSKKGENRGAARREAKRRQLANLTRGGAHNKGKTTKKVRERLALIGKEIGVAQLNGTMPKEMMLNIARTFMQMALNEQAKIAALEEGDFEDERRELSAAYERHLVLAGDMSYKAGAYYHPRLQALIVGGGQDKSPGDILRSMLDEIDDESRQERQQSRQIEHQPNSEDVVDLELRKAKGG